MTDMKNIDSIFENAFKEGRRYLYEYEVYEILNQLGVQTLKYIFIPVNEKVNTEIIRKTFTGNAVIKVVSTGIIHKTEAAGVEVGVPVAEIEQTINRMVINVAETYSQWIVKNPGDAPSYYKKYMKNEESLKKAILNDITGFLVIEELKYSSQFGNELLLGINYDEAFGPIALFGVGGIKADFFIENMKTGSGFIIGSPFVLDEKKFVNLYNSLPVYKVFSGQVRGSKKMIEDTIIDKVVFSFYRLATEYTSLSKTSEWNILEAEVNPFVISDGKIVPLDGLIKFERSDYKKTKKPIHKIDNLLNPKTVGIIGVSGKKPTPAGTILKNLQKSGFQNENIFIIHPTEEKIANCVCYKSLNDLQLKLGNEKIDMFVIGIPAIAPPGRSAGDIIEQLIKKEMTESITIISAGFDETKKGTEKTEKIKELLHKSHLKKGGGVVCNGPNTLGNLYYNIDTRFTPAYKSSVDGIGKENVALICQSGAFMLTRLSNLAGSIDPRIAISIGNQIDLTLSDYLKFLKTKDEINVFAIYVEGFKELDGLEFAKISQELTKNNKKVVLYKAGKTPEGKDAAKGHTASAASDYSVIRSVLAEAGVFVAESFEEFQNMIKLFSMLEGTVIKKTSKLPGLGALTNAGFEKCAIGDNIYDENNNKIFKISNLSKITAKKIELIFSEYHLDDFIDIAEILDLTPIANDEVYEKIIKAVIEDENVDCGLFSIVPETQRLQTMNGFISEDFYSQKSIAQKLIRVKKETKKPFIVSVESGKLYNPFVYELEENGIPTFRSVDTAAKAFGKYVNFRIKNRIFED